VCCTPETPGQPNSYHTWVSVNGESRPANNNNEDVAIVSKMATTTNVHGGDDVTATVSHSSDLTGASSSSADQTVHSFLERPVVINSFSWTTAQSRGSSIFEVNLDTAFASVGAVWWNKLQGFGLMRATMVLTFQLNASKMNSGALLGYFMPGKSASPELYQYRTSLTSLTQLPSAVIDAQQHEMTFDLPFISPLSRYDLVQKGSVSPWGSFGVSVYSPLKNGSTGTNTADCIVWMSFKDVELSMPIVAQAGRGRFKAKPHPSEQELGPISKTLKAASVMASTLATIPTLATIAGPVSWFTNIASGVASAFGWSKPQDDTTGERVIITTHAGSNNVNGVDHSHQLGLASDNKVRVIPDLGNGEQDELSLSFIKSQWAYIRAFSWPTTANLGTQLFSLWLIPRDFGAVQSGVAPTPGNPIFPRAYSPVAFLATLFQYYRGGFCLKFRIPKTELHSGRLMIAFKPGTDDVNLDISQTTGLARHIVDIQAGSEICLEFPYLLEEEMIQTGQAIGKLFVFVVNPLRCPATVSQDVDVLVEVKGLPELEFHVPRRHSLVPIVPQSGLEGGIKTIVESPVGDLGAQGPSSVSQYTVGEQIMSLLQLLKRYYKISGRYEGSWNGMDVTRTKSLNPFATNAVKLAEGSLAAPAIGLDLLSLFSSCYLFSRGGVRLRFITTGTRTVYAYWLDSPTYNATYESSDDAVSLWDQSGANDRAKLGRVGYMSPCIVDSAYGGFSMQIPAYCPARARYNKIPNSRGALTQFDSNVMASWSAVPDGTTQTSASRPMHILRACADDFQMSFWLGVPHLIIYEV